MNQFVLLAERKFQTAHTADSQSQSTLCRQIHTVCRAIPH